MFVIVDVWCILNQRDIIFSYTALKENAFAIENRFVFHLRILPANRWMDARHNIGQSKDDKLRFSTTNLMDLYISRWVFFVFFFWQSLCCQFGWEIVPATTHFHMRKLFMILWQLLPCQCVNGEMIDGMAHFDVASWKFLFSFMTVSYRNRRQNVQEL